MLRFRPPDPHAVLGDINDLMAVSGVIDAAMRPGCFFVAPDLRLNWIAAKSETILWEIYRGRLLGAAQTRQHKSFLSWHVVESKPDEPTISVKLDVHERQIHVVRGFAAYQWEGYDAGGGVIESREVVGWQRELVGTITLADCADMEPVRDELICLILQAVVGTSRLPLTSVESPLPAFVFGRLHYCFRINAAALPMASWEELLHACSEGAVAPQETVKLVEFVLRLADVIESLRFLGMFAQTKSPFVQDWKGWTVLWRQLFNNVSLSPQTRLIRNALTTMTLALPIEERTDCDSHLLRQLSRHLSAYDLITFHHRGANYPDALLLDDVLKRFVQTAELFPELFLGNEPKTRSRRRAMRQACLIRRHYEGHLVPDSPTSPGENARVMPASHPRVPDDQLLQMNRRHRQLFEADALPQLLSPNARRVLEESVRDVDQIDERVELGLGVFIDRPLGYAKSIGEPDLTPLLAHEAFSPSLARRRWGELKKLCAELGIACDAEKLDPLFENGPRPDGLPHTELADCPRPTAALADVRKVANDFVILRTLPRGLAQVLDRLEPALKHSCASPRLFVQCKNGALTLFDQDLRPCVELVVDASRGFITRAGVEWPRGGLRFFKSSEPEE